MTWHQKITWLYDNFYRDNGGMGLLASDLGVSRLTVQYWYHCPTKTNPATGKPVEPSWENRISIDGLAKKKMLT